MHFQYMDINVIYTYLKHKGFSRQRGTPSDLVLTVIVMKVGVTVQLHICCSTTHCAKQMPTCTPNHTYVAKYDEFLCVVK